MRKGFGIAGLVVLLGSGTALADKPQMDAQSQAMMAEMQKLGTPGLEHKALAPLAGSFTAVVRMWMGGPKPVENTGTADGKAILGGRFYEEVFTGTVMGQPFEGRGLIGYDNAKKKYVWSWIDSMTTALSTAEGTADATGKVITLKGESYDPATKKMAPVKYVFRIESDKKHTFESWELVNGKETRTMEVVYTRK
jgi:hypothetical protein